MHSAGSSDDITVMDAIVSGKQRERITALGEDVPIAENAAAKP